MPSRSNDVYLEKAGTMIVSNAAEDQVRLYLMTKRSSIPLGKLFCGLSPSVGDKSKVRI